MRSERPVDLLYVNDDDQLRELVSRQLRAESDRLRIETADSAAEGERLLAERAIDCVLCDHHMPDVTGVEFLRSVREDRPDLPFLLFTNTGTETVASESIEAGVTDYVIQDAVENQAPLLARKIVTYVEHRRAQRERDRTNRRLREIAAVTDQVWWVFSPTWDELRFINDGHEAIFGQPADELRDDPTTFLDRIHGDDVARVQQAMESASAGTPQVVEYRVEKSETVEIWAESRCKPITDDDGAVTSLVGLTRDITDRKLYQRELTETIDQLEEFTGTVSHDLRNPLNVAAGNLSLAAAERDDERVDTALNAVQRMDALVDELLTLAREGKTLSDRSEVPYAEIVSKSYENVRAPESSLRIEESVALSCDSARLTEAFENVIRNAVEHGGSSVALTAGVLPDGRGVFIEDDGPGIAPEDRERVFEKGHTTRRDGSGFGLAIVERIVDAHGWDVRIDEGDAGGARFEIVT
ncbi:response regulator [Halorubrum sp. Atlit-8R]|uniref:ATP-binding response regulator n=1 Tax=unclassified Halorubrum TaxID=2642239 RepID=UPI000EF1CC06|nr:MULTISPECIES: ATP-binding protein [unclassified Halorubrum]RLM66874.1 response regulator [Halorubrum sp. Atlit-9R]RLM81697.1 response regulator [Halorubrum sp. Atlit-8R]